MGFSEIQKALEDIANSSLDAYTKAIALFCAEVIILGDDAINNILMLDEIIATEIDPERACACFEVYSQMLTRILVVHNKAVNIQKLQTAEHKERVASTRELLNSMAKGRDDITKRFIGKYSKFQPSWQYGELLSMRYEENDDPGKIIGDHIKILLPLDASEQLIEKATVPPRWDVKIKKDSQVYNHIYKLGIWLINNCGYSDEIRDAVTLAFESILDANYIKDNNKNDSLESVLVAALNTPSIFLFNWLQGYFLMESGITLAQLETVLLYYPIGEGNTPIIHTHPWLNDKRSLLYLMPNKLENKVVPWEIFYDICGETMATGNIYGHNDNTVKIINTILARYTLFRRKTCHGISSLDFNTMRWVPELFFENDVALDGLDIVMLLAYGDATCTKLFLKDIFSNDNSVAKACRYFDVTFEYYKLMFNKANYECLYELATALLAFYLFARSITCNCKFGDLTEIIPLIDFAMDKPGSKTLKITLTNIIGWIDEYYASEPSAQLAKKVFRPFVPVKADLHLLSNKQRSNENNAMKWLISEIGEVRIGKLTQKSITWLLDYRIEWMLHCQEYGFGIKDFSGLIGKHSKVVENEIICHYRDMHLSVEYKSYLAQYKNRTWKNKPTLGELLRDLAKYNDKNFPESLKQLLQSNKMQLHNDKNTINKLIMFTDEYRNKAAHTEQITMTNYSKFVEMFYHEKLLCNLIDTIR